jgi:hypothetical protein
MLSVSRQYRRKFYVYLGGVQLAVIISGTGGAVQAGARPADVYCLREIRGGCTAWGEEYGHTGYWPGGGNE